MNHSAGPGPADSVTTERDPAASAADPRLGGGHPVANAGGSTQAAPAEAGRPEQAEVAGPPRRGKLMPVLSVVLVLAVLLGGSGAYSFFVLKYAPTGASASRPAALVVPKGPEHVLSVAPVDGAAAVNGGGPITVHFGIELSKNSPMPVLTPPIAGAWAQVANDAVFTPTRGYYPGTKVTLTIPAGATGVVTAANGHLASPMTVHFTVGHFSTVRLEQLLAQLGYLPLTWAPTTGAAAPLTDLNAQWSAAFDPPAGTYTWSSLNYPAELTSLWAPDRPSKILQGAVAAFQADQGLMDDMVYENQNGLTLTGDVGQRLWAAMFKAIAAGQVNTHGYTYALASQKMPETLTVWHNGVRIFRHLANTGIGVAPTAVRTDPVYIRYRYQIMRGTNPDGSKYIDPVAWVAYFHAGEAVHYFYRYSYGSQQSLGCVELPEAQAKWIWPYLTYGTLVTVTSP